MEFKESRIPNQSRNSRVNYVIRQQNPITFSQLTAQDKQKIADYTASNSNAQSIIYDHLNSYSLNVENKDSLARNFAYNSYAQDISMSYMRFDDNLGSYFDSYLGVEKGFKSMMADFVSRDEPAVNRIYSGIRLSKIDAEFKTEIDKVAAYSGDKAGAKSGAIAGDAAGERVANLRYDEAYSSGHNAGYSSGQVDGYKSGHNAGYSEGFTAGVASVKPAEPEVPKT